MNGYLDDAPLRAPRRDGEAVVQPDWPRLPALIRENQLLRHTSQAEVLGRPLAALAAQARGDLLREALRYTRAYRDVATPIPAERVDLPVILAGHQPELFHPGVWFKNFALGHLARGCGGVAVQLLIDNDLCRAPSIRVPAGSLASPEARVVVYDRPGAEVPYEQRRLLDPGTFRAFGRRVAEAIAPWVPDPLVRQLWPQVERAARRTDNLGRCLAEGRHRLEGQWGLETLELPLSVPCDGEPFLWFVASVLVRLPEFQEIYNGSLEEFRREQRIRSRTHPVAALDRQDAWREAPFWVWRDDQPQRGRLLCRPGAGGIELSDGQQRVGLLSWRGDGDAAKVVEQLQALRASGVKIRPRALMTTMFARMLLGDLFVHGIGGARYDRLTDRLIRRSFNVQPPSYVAISATAWLPVPRPDVAPEDLRQVDHLLRELQYHPERHLDVADIGGERNGSLAHWVAEKERWVRMQLPRGACRQRHEQIGRANEALRPGLAHRRQLLLEERSRLRELLHQRRLLDSREYAFCLHPAAELRRLLEGLLPGGASRCG